MPLLVENHANNPTIFAKGETTIIWQAKGDPMGNDVQRCPDAFADDVDFLKSLDVGLLVCTHSDKPELMERLVRSSAQYQERQESAAKHHAGLLDRKQDRDIVSIPCVGPNLNGRGVGTCEASVLVRAAKQGEVPPLCPRHEALAPNFYLTTGGSRGEGATDTTPGKTSAVWKQAEVTASAR